MKSNLIPNVQPQITTLVPYTPGLPIEALARKSGLPVANISKLASNENPYGMSPRSKTALRTAASTAHLYPDGHNLRTALAAHFHLSPDHIALSNGSTEILELIARIFLGPHTEAVSSQYGFIVYATVTHATGARNSIVPATAAFGHDLTAMHAAITPLTRVIWLANPNNPTGTFIPYPVLETFLQSLPSHLIVVLDEAYYDYLPPEQRLDTTAWLASHPNLILVRTFSKIYGLAGLRIGYSLSSPAIAELLNRLRNPFNVNTLGLAAAMAALADQPFVRLSYERNRRGRRQLEDGFTRLGIKYLPSAGNFVTAHFSAALATYNALLEQGIIVRPLANYDLPEHLRISVGRPTENTRLLSALRSLIEKPLHQRVN